MTDKQSPNLEEYLGILENHAYNAHYDLDLSNSPNIVLRPNVKGIFPPGEMPVIFGEFQTDGVRFWFEPRMQFPKMIQDNAFEGSYSAHMRDWVGAGKLADYLIENIWDIETEE